MLNISEAQFARFERFIEEHETFIVVGHKEPDGDCISSSLVLADIIRRKGKKAHVLSAGPFKRTETKKYEPLFASHCETKKNSNERIGLFIVDCSELSRLGETVESQVKNFDRFIIDHHKTANTENNNSIIDSSSPATACLIQQLYEHCFDTMPQNIAELLFFGLTTDTGFFRFLNNKSEPVFYAAGRLVKAGADPRSAYENMNSGKPLATRKLLSLALERIGVHCGGKLLTTYETMEDTKKFGYDGRDTDMLYLILMATENVRAVAFFRQENSSNCTVGFRSTGDLDVSAVAALFFGGGHKNAAGLSIDGKLSDIIPKIIAEFEKIL